MVMMRKLIWFGTAHHDNKETVKAQKLAKTCWNGCPGYPIARVTLCAPCALWTCRWRWRCFGSFLDTSAIFLKDFMISWEVLFWSILLLWLLTCQDYPKLTSICVHCHNQQLHQTILFNVFGRCLGPTMSDNFPSTASFFKGFMKPPLSKKLRKSASLDLWSLVKRSTWKRMSSLMGGHASVYSIQALQGKSCGNLDNLASTQNIEWSWSIVVQFLFKHSPRTKFIMMNEESI